MKKLVLSFLLLSVFNGFSQSSAPPPLGTSPWYAVDVDNDGSAPFDIAYFISAIFVPDLEALTGQSLTGYDIWADTEAGVPLSPIYYNVSDGQQIDLTFVYNGNGPEFVPFEVSGWPMPIDFFGHFTLNAIPFDGDADNDGISNADEDLNGNLALNDDNNGSLYWPYFLDPDDDGDGTLTIEEDYNNNGNPMDDDINENGVPDYLDPSATLATAKFALNSFVLVPNPASDRLTVVVPNGKVASIVIIDTTGRIVLEANTANPIHVSQLSSGNYWVKITSEREQSIKKLIIE